MPRDQQSIIKDYHRQYFKSNWFKRFKNEMATMTRMQQTLYQNNLERDSLRYENLEEEQGPNSQHFIFFVTYEWTQ
jgi:hypothetical protein